MHAWLRHSRASVSTASRTPARRRNSLAYAKIKGMLRLAQNTDDRDADRRARASHRFSPWAAGAGPPRRICWQRMDSAPAAGPQTPQGQTKKTGRNAVCEKKKNDTIRSCGAAPREATACMLNLFGCQDALTSTSAMTNAQSEKRTAHRRKVEAARMQPFSAARMRSQARVQ